MSMARTKFPVAFIPVKGGLGNQMFIYAFGQYLKENKIEPKLVWHEYIFNSHHNGVESLNIFDITISKFHRFQIACFIAANSILPQSLKTVLGKIFERTYSLFFKKYYQISPYSFDDVVSGIEGNNVYMDGFWQNYKYLLPIKNKILKLFSFRLPENFSDNQFLKKIINTNSVSIHIRRNDYLNPTFQHFNVIKSIDYYLRSIDFVKSKCENPEFFIFTDDMQWAKKNFKGANYNFVEGNVGKLSYLDLYLISKCKHNIIANSTFSWWGGWLNKNPSKMVIAPNIWTTTVQSSHFCPPEWIFLEVNGLD